MKNLVPTLYKNYGLYINKFRAFPLVLDGLKIVERRILYTLYDIARDHFVKSAKAVGFCMGNFHPHGNSSIYETMVTMVGNGIAAGQGNWGSDIGIEETEPAAERYTEIKSTKEILDLAFEFIKYVDLEPLELDPEPVFLPTKLPICLITKHNYQGIGFGSRTVIPSFKKDDLIKRLEWLLGYNPTEPFIKPINDGKLISPKEEILKLLTTGEAKLDYEGIYQKDDKSITVRSLPPSKSFSTLFSSFKKEIEVEKSLGLTDESCGRDGTKVRFTILRPRILKMETLEKKMKKLLLGGITYECNMCDVEGKVVLVSVDKMLLLVYHNYKQVVEKYLKTNINVLTEKIQELKLIQLIKSVLPGFLQQFPDNPDLLITNISTATSIPVEKIKELFEKFNINRLLKVKVDIENVELDRSQYETNLSNLDSFIWDKKYKI